MNENARLVKVIKNKDNSESVACAFYGTDRCQMNKGNSCVGCDYICLMMAKLYEFEKIYYGGEYIEYAKEEDDTG